MSIQKVKVGRNDPCICESGLKYKKCCLSKEISSAMALSAQQKIQQRLRQSAEKHYGDQVIFHDQETEIKMSEIILELANDFLSGAESRDEVKNIIAATCMAWNIATAFPEDGHATQIEKIASDMNADDMEQSLCEFIALMIDRKLDWYPHVERFIIDYDIHGKPNNIHLNVISSLQPEEIGL